MTLREINDFSTRDSEKLSRELSTFEDNVARELREIQAATAPVVGVRSYTYSAPGVVSAAFDEQLSIDSSLGNVSVVVPALSSKNFGRPLRIIKRNGTNTVTLACQDPTVLLNGGTFSLAITAAGVTTLFCDSKGYYR